MKWKALEAIEILIRAWQLRRTKLEPTDNAWEDVVDRSPGRFSILSHKIRSKKKEC